MPLIQRFLAGILALLLAPCAWAAPDWPSRPIQLIVPFVPGGGTDILARLVAPALSQALGAQVIVLNKPGAASIIGTDFVAKSRADGYTVLLTDTSLIVNPSLQKSLPYDTLKDLQPVLHAAYAPVLLVIHPSVPAHSVRELIELARKEPHKLSFASGGNGSSTHLAGEQFKLAANLDLVHVPYKGVGAALPDVVGGQESMMFAAIGTAGQFVADGKLRALALTGEKRHPAMPDVPTFIEAGYPKIDARTDWGFLVPSGTPAAIVTRLNAELEKALQSPQVSKRLTDLGYVVGKGSPDDYRALLRREIPKWKIVIQKAGIQPQ